MASAEMDKVTVAARAGAKVTLVERPWGEGFSPADLKDALAKAKPKVVGIVMAETSTGAWQSSMDKGDRPRRPETIGCLHDHNSGTGSGGVGIVSEFRHQEPFWLLTCTLG